MAVDVAVGVAVCPPGVFVGVGDEPPPPPPPGDVAVGVGVGNAIAKDSPGRIFRASVLLTGTFPSKETRVIVTGPGASIIVPNGGKGLVTMCLAMVSDEPSESRVRSPVSS